MFRRYKIWRAEVGLAEARQKFSSWGQESGKTQREIIDRIVYAKRDSGVNWNVAQKNEEVGEQMYELLLHQQFMAYLAETVRQKAGELYSLKNNVVGLDLLTAHHIHKIWTSKEDLGSSQANHAKTIIYQEFIDNILPRLERVELQIFGADED